MALPAECSSKQKLESLLYAYTDKLIAVNQQYKKFKNRNDIPEMIDIYSNKMISKVGKQMNEDKAQEIRIEDILGEDNLKISYKSLMVYRDYIQNKILFPCDLTGREDFQWEEIYVFGSGDKNEYAELKKTQPSYTDTYTFMSFDDQIEDNNGLMVKVKRLSDSKQFVLPLADLKVIDKTSPNHDLIHDYAVWHVNY